MLFQFRVTLTYNFQFFCYFQQLGLKFSLCAHFLYFKGLINNAKCKQLVDDLECYQTYFQPYKRKQQMQESYLGKYTKNNSKFLPSIQSKKMKSYEMGMPKLKQATQQSLMLEIQDIDASLNNKNFSCHHGILFSSQISDKVITQLHSSLKKLTLIMEDGFSLWNGVNPNQTDNKSNETKRLSNKLQTLNERMVKLSLQNVYDYDLKKYLQIMKANKSRWSLFKRIDHQNPTSSKITKVQASELTEKLRQESHRKSENNEVPQPIKESFHTNLSPSSNHSTMNPLSKIQKSLEQTNKISRISRISDSRAKNISKRKVLTEISQIQSPQDEVPQISKHDIKSMLKKQDEHLVFLWLPPATYPQFNGMFCYASTKKVAICKLKKYFFFRRSLSQRFFNSILEQISSREDKYIQGIQIITNRNDYSKVYEPIGWKMKSIQGMDKIRIRFARP